MKSHLPRLLWHFVSRWKGNANADVATHHAGYAAFADILLLGGVRIHAPDLAEVHQDGSPHNERQQDIQETIIVELAEHLDASGLGTVSAAFECLRSILAEVQPGSIGAVTASEDMRVIAAAAARSPLIVARQYSNQLDHLKAGEEWVKKAEKRSEWQRDFAGLVTEALAARDEFYGPLLTAIRNVPSFATQVLPHLIHALLLYEEGQAKSPCKQTLSKYFTKLLEARSPVGQDILDLVIALRAYNVAENDSKQSTRQRTKWLQISWKLLAEAAGSLHKPHAALMFLELARDGGDTAGTIATEAQQDLLYGIYGEIDEPDSFYSIKALNPQTGLLKQLEHEGRWTDALSWHAGGLEARSVDSRSANALSNVVHAMARSDLPRLAMDLLLPQMSEGSGSLQLPTGLEHHLAWKTEAWDLPLANQRASGNPEVNLFEALRAIYRSLDRSNVEDTMHSGLRREVQRLLGFAGNLSNIATPNLGQIVAMRELQKTWYLLDAPDKTASLSLDALPPVP